MSCRCWLALIGQAAAHGWYTEKTDPVLHYKCCGNEDCHPLDSGDVRSARDGGYFVRQSQPFYRNDPPTGEWYIPKDRVQAAPDDRYHICEPLVPAYRVGKLKRRWTCFFAPMSTSSITPSEKDWGSDSSARQMQIVNRSSDAVSEGRPASDWSKGKYSASQSPCRPRESQMRVCRPVALY